MISESPPGGTNKKRVAAKGDRTKELLINTAITMISEKGVAGTSVLEITQALQISNGTFYYHFQNFDQLLEDVGDRVIKRLVDQIGSVTRIDPAAQVARGPMVILLFAQRRPELRAVMLHVLNDPESSHGELEQNLQEDIESGRRMARFAVQDTELAVKLCKAINASALRCMRETAEAYEALAIATAVHSLAMLGVPIWEAHAIAQSEMDSLRLESSG